MKIVAMIPARYAATRFPAKLMQLLGEQTVITRTYRAVQNTGLFGQVYVVTDSRVIYEEIVSNGGAAIMSRRSHESGSDRIAEAIADLDVDVVLNVQGDEPFIQAEPLRKLVQLFDDPSVRVGSLMRRFTDFEELQKPSAVKVVLNRFNDALYFSRSVIPHNPLTTGSGTGSVASPGHYLHVGVYGYRKQTLLDFTGWQAGILEQAEKLEQLRYLENGVPIRMAEVDFEGVAIDTPEDLEHARSLLNAGKYR